MITGNGKIRLGRNVEFNSSFKSNTVGGFRSVLETRTKDASRSTMTLFIGKHSKIL
jgi:hypothetical protein